MKYGARHLTLLAGAALLGMAATANAQDNQQWMNEAQFTAKVDGLLKGKRVAWVPVSMAHSLPAEWTRVMKQELGERGIDFVVRDPDYNADRQSQIVATLINEKPDLLILHNPNVQLLAKQIQQAQAAGIPVMQVNMASNFKSDAYVGADSVTMGARMADDVVSTCANAASKKIAIMKGELTSAISIDITKGINQVLEKNPDIKVVAEQSQGGWDTKAFYDASASAILQNPDLCAVVSYWEVPGVGVIQALKEAGKQPGDVKIITSGGGDPVGCQYIKEGWYTSDWSYQGTQQGYQIVNMALTLLQQRAAGIDTSKATVAVYSPLLRMAKDNINDDMCYKINQQ